MKGYIFIAVTVEVNIAVKKKKKSYVVLILIISKQISLHSDYFLLEKLYQFYNI